MHFYVIKSREDNFINILEQIVVNNFQTKFIKMEKRDMLLIEYLLLKQRVFASDGQICANIIWNSLLPPWLN